MEVRKPEECALAVEMLAHGRPLAEVTRETGLTHGALTALRYRHSEAIEVRRMRAADDAEHTAERYRLLAQARADQLMDDPEALKKVNPKDLMLAYGIARDKASTLRGDATVTVEHKKGFSLEDAAKMIEAARKNVNAEVVDV